MVSPSASYNASIEISMPFYVITRFSRPDKLDQRDAAQPISSVQESQNIEDDFVYHEELSFPIPNKPFQHIQSSAASRVIGNQLVRKCSVCMLLKSEREYRAPLSINCRPFHRTVCYDCVYHTIIVLLGSTISESVKCPELICSAKLSVDDVRQILTYYGNKALLDKYDTYLASALLEEMPDFIWCAHGCGSGQLHPSFTPKVDCIACKQPTCFFHHVPWHEGLTCEEYDVFGPTNDAVNLKYLKLFTKQCPRCKVNIEKNKGCDHMTCTRCRAGFCWNCLAVFGPGDNLYTCPHKANCIYFRTETIRYQQRYYGYGHDYRPSRLRRLRSILCNIL